MEYIKFIFACVIITVFAGCGGSESESAQSIPQENTPPTLNGEAQFEVKALETTSITVEVNDADGDALTLSMPTQPDWVNHSIENSQVVLKLTPDLFDLGSHDLRVQVSDGVHVVEHAIQVDVRDNSAQWGVETMSPSSLAGVWVDEEKGSRFIFSENANGVWITTEAVFTLRYFLASDGTIQLHKYATTCALYCQGYSVVNMTVIASEQDKLKIHLAEQDNSQVYTVVKEQAPEPSPGFFARQHISAQSVFSEINLDGQASVLEVPIFLYIQGERTERGTVIATADFSNGAFGIANEDGRFYDVIEFSVLPGDFNGIFTVSHEIENIQILYSDENVLIGESTHSARLEEDYDPGEIAELEEALAQQSSIFIKQAVTSASVPPLEAGERYSGRLTELDSRFREDSFYRYSKGGSFEVVSSNDIKLISYEPVDDASTAAVEDEFSYEDVVLVEDGAHLRVMAGDDERNAQFFTTLSGDTFVAYQRDDGLWLASEFKQVTHSDTLTMEQASGVYKDLRAYPYFYSEGVTFDYFVLAENGRAAIVTEANIPQEPVATDYGNYCWGIRLNKIVMINDRRKEATDFDSCLALAASFYSAKSLEPLGDDLYLYSYLTVGDDYPMVGRQTLIRLEKQD